METTTGAAVRTPSSPPTHPDAAAAMPPALPICTTPSSSRRGVSVGEFVDASFASFERTYGSCCLDGKIEEERQPQIAENDDDDDDDESFHSSFWSAVSTVYLPILFLWLRRSMFGTAHLLRSLVLGHVLRLLFTYITPPSWMTTTTTSRDTHSSWWDSLCQNPWIQPLLDPKADPHAWPPPAFTALAILTIFAFVVHPDGLTWIVLGKLRDGIMSLLQSTTTLFTMIQEHGILVTLAASVTLAALVFLAGILYKTLSPRTNPHHTPHVTTKKKKRKGHHHRGRAGRIRGAHQQQQIRSTTTGSKTTDQRQQHRQRQQLHLPTLNPSDGSPPEPEKETLSTPPRPPAKTVDSISTTRSTPQRLPATTTETAPARARIATLDTIPLADDQSCDSMSVRSISSAPTRTGTASVQSGKVSNTNTNTESVVGKGKQSQNKRKQQGKHNNKKTSLDHPDTTNSGKSTGRFSSLGAPPKSTSATQTTAPTSPVPSFTPSRASTTTNKQGSKRSDGRRGNHRKGRGSAATTASSTSPVVNRPRYDSTNNNSSFFSSTPLSPRFSPADRSVPKQQQQQQQQRLAPISPPLSHSSLFSNGHVMSSPFGGQNNNNNSLQSPPRRGPVIGASPDAALSGGSSVRYSVPNYAGSFSYAQDSRYTPGKMELAAFLAQVGLMGAACADLLADLPNVDALEVLTDAEFHKYKIVPAKQAQISLLLEARRRKQELEAERSSSKLSQWSSGRNNNNSNVVRPPPGLGGPAAVVPSGSVVKSNNNSELNVGSPGLPWMRAGSGNNNTNGPPTYPSLEPQTTTLSSSSAAAAAPAESRFAAHFGKGQSAFVGGSQQTETSHPFVTSSYGPAVDAHDAATRKEEEDDDSSQIEAELQELGGQMIGSILDF